MTRRRGKSGALYLGIEIGGTKLQLCAGNADGKILERIKFTVDKNAAADGIRRQLKQTLPDLAKRIKPAAIGVGFGGPVDWTTGRIYRSHQIEGWSGFSLAAWLSKLAGGIPVRVDNDANLGSYGEALHGAGRGVRSVFYVTLGSGVGGGLVADKMLYHGAKPGECEIGHVRIDRSGKTLESVCAGWVVDARLRKAARSDPSGALAKLIGKARANEAKFLAAALAAKDPDAKQILDDAAGHLAFGLSHVTHLFHPDMIVLGGGLALVGEPLRAAVECSLRPNLMKVLLPGPRIALSKLREDAVPVGALGLAASK